MLFLWLSLTYELIGAYTLYYRLQSWNEGITFVVTVALVIFMLVTVVNIQKQASVGRMLGIIAFAILIATCFGSILLLVELHSRSGITLLLPELIVGMRIGCSAIFLAAFLFSSGVMEYFSPDPEILSAPPPPPVFED